MLAAKTRPIFRSLVRRICTCLMLLCYVATALGLPVPVFPAKDCSRPFPCQDHFCGCQSASDCWQHCCCFTPEERASWALDRGVEAPPDCSSSAPGGWQSIRLRDRQADACTSCLDHLSELPANSCPSRSPQTRNPSCGDACSTTDSGAGKCIARHAPPTCRFASLNVLRCRGVSSVWVSQGCVLAPPLPLDCKPYLDLADRLVGRDHLACLHFAIPPDPPPRGI
jgi:hypothetical protein